jgi:hypothetical protein
MGFEILKLSFYFHLYLSQIELHEFTKDIASILSTRESLY